MSLQGVFTVVNLHACTVCYYCALNSHVKTSGMSTYSCPSNISTLSPRQNAEAGNEDFSVVLIAVQKVWATMYYKNSVRLPELKCHQEHGNITVFSICNQWSQLPNCMYGICVPQTSNHIALGPRTSLLRLRRPAQEPRAAACRATLRRRGLGQPCAMPCPTLRITQHYWSMTTKYPAWLWWIQH